MPRILQGPLALVKPGRCSATSAQRRIETAVGQDLPCALIVGARAKPNVHGSPLEVRNHRGQMPHLNDARTVVECRSNMTGRMASSPATGVMPESTTCSVAADEGSKQQVPTKISKGRFYQRQLPESCTDLSSAEGKRRFAESMVRAPCDVNVYFPLAAQFRTQDEPA